MYVFNIPVKDMGYLKTIKFVVQHTFKLNKNLIFDIFFFFILLNNVQYKFWSRLVEQNYKFEISKILWHILIIIIIKTILSL